MSEGFYPSRQVLDSIYFSRRFHVRCVAKAVDKVGHVGTPLRSNIVTIGTDSAICHTPVVAGTARGFQAQSFIATLKYLDVKHKEHPNRSGWRCLHSERAKSSWLLCEHFLGRAGVRGMLLQSRNDGDAWFGKSLTPSSLAWSLAVRAPFLSPCHVYLAATHRESL